MTDKKLIPTARLLRSPKLRLPARVLAWSPAVLILSGCASPKDEATEAPVLPELVLAFQPQVSPPLAGMQPDAPSDSPDTVTDDPPDVPAQPDDPALPEEPPASDPALEPHDAEINIDAASVIRTIPRTLYGTNIEWIYDGWGLWDASAAGLDPQLVALTRDLGATLLRFPGGVFSDYYHWADGVGPQGSRPLGEHYAGGPLSRHNFGTDEARTFAASTGSNLLITVNAGTGAPDEAAAWVQYVSQGGQRVAWWEVGNELYAAGSPTSDAITLTPEQYAARFLEFAGAMRSADPTIRIGAIGGETQGRYIATAYPGWNATLLARAGAEMDFLAVHNGYAPLVFVDDGRDLRTVYRAMLAAPVLLRRNLETISSQIETFAPAPARDRMRIAVTEWGPFFHALPSSPYVDHVKTLGSALFVAGTLKALIDAPRVEVATAFKPVDTSFMGWIGVRGGAFAPKAPYYAMQMFARHFGSRLIASSCSAPTYDSTAIGFIDAVDDVPWLETVCSLSSDGRTLYVIAINRHFDRPLTALVRVNGFTPAATATVRVLDGSGIDANTGTELPQIPGLTWAAQSQDPENPRFALGGPGEIAVTSATINTTSKTFLHTFPAHSLSCIELPAR